MKTWIIVLLLAVSVFSEKVKVTFVNPGGMDDPFFSRLCNTMEAAAKDFDISLEILYSGRDYIRGLEVGNTVFNRESQPDFLLLINENGMAERLVQRADSLGIKTLLFNEGFSESYLKRVGNPVEVFENCIAEFLPDDSLAGYLLAEELIKAKRKSKPEGEITILGVTGSPRTTSSEKRTAGLKQAIADAKDVTLLQTAPAYWDEQKAETVAANAFKRYKSIDIIWSASDKMAEGILKSIRADEKNSLVGGIDWATFAFDRVQDGDFAVSVGGHFFDGAWAIVLIADYVKNGSLPQKHFLSNSFDLVNRENVETLLPILKKAEWDYIDFTTYTHSENDTGSYDFTLKTILEVHNGKEQ